MKGGDKERVVISVLLRSLFRWMCSEGVENTYALGSKSGGNVVEGWKLDERVDTAGCTVKELGCAVKELREGDENTLLDERMEATSLGDGTRMKEWRQRRWKMELG